MASAFRAYCNSCALQLRVIASGVVGVICFVGVGVWLCEFAAGRRYMVDRCLKQLRSKVWFKAQGARVSCGAMRIVSIDVGTKNMALCQVDRSTNVISRWELVQLKGDDLCQSIYETFEGLQLKDYDVALVEMQPSNRRMIRAEAMMAMYLTTQQIGQVVTYAPVNKLRNVAGVEKAKGKGKVKYAMRKKLSVGAVTSWLQEHRQPGELGRQLVNRFNGAAKKDDLADALLQALSYSEVQAAAEPPAVIKARKPTDKQVAKGSVTLPNLKWLIQQALDSCGNVLVLRDEDEEFEEGEVRRSDVLARLQAATADNRVITAAIKRHRFVSDEAAFGRLGLL